VKGSAPHGVPVVSVVDTNCIRTWWTGLFQGTMMRCGRFVCSLQRFSESVANQSRLRTIAIGDQKAAADPALADGVELWTPAPTNNTKAGRRLVEAATEEAPVPTEPQSQQKDVKHKRAYGRNERWPVPRRLGAGRL